MKKLLIALAATAVFASCHNNADNAAAIESAKQATIDSMNMVNAEKDRAEHEARASKKRSTAVAPSGSESTGSTASTGTTAAPAKKKGWSHTAKGAVVGAGAGAITGAIINKDRVKGAAIGTIVGAGVGAGVGAIVDHEKKKKEAAKQQ